MQVIMRNSKHNHSKFYYSSRFWVCLYALVMAMFMTFQIIIGCLENGTLKVPEFIARFISGQASLPMETLAWMWTALVSLYCGFDRVVDIRNTMQLSSGTMNLGDLAKLRGIIMLSLLLLVVGTVGHITTGRDFQLAALASAFGSSIIIYVSGNKAVKAVKYKCLDENNDGVPDEVEDDYHAWVRARKKEGVEAEFLTLEYFLDEHPELREKLK